MKWSPYYNIETERPHLVKEWNYKKNFPELPRYYTHGQDVRMWWICEKGHEWEAGIGQRSGGTGCPYCDGKLVCEDNCLQTLNPALAREWHPTKNGDLTPEGITPNSTKKVWWICEKGHEWQSNVEHRNYGRGCPYCAGKAVCDDNCLQTINPEIAREWHPTKNALLTPRDVTACSGKKVWWLCKKGHEWIARISDRKSYGSGCPYCAGQAACKDNCLQALKPAVAREWHPTKNGNLTPKDVTLKSNKKVWWICKKGHEWIARIADRTVGTGCPYCTEQAVFEDNCLQAIDPTLAKEWHPTKNGVLTPRDVTYSTDRKVWWICKKGHEWIARISGRNAGRGCPYCVGRAICEDNCLKTINPGLAKEWHPTKNKPLTPEDVAPGSSRKVWWICKKGHEWQATIANRKKGSGCPYCSNKAVCEDNCLQNMNSHLADEWHPTKNGNLTPRDVTSGTRKKVWWVCKEGHEWQATIADRNQGSGCPICRIAKRIKEKKHKEISQSAPEHFIY